MVSGCKPAGVSGFAVGTFSVLAVGCCATGPGLAVLVRRDQCRRRAWSQGRPGALVALTTAVLSVSIAEMQRES